MNASIKVISATMLASVISLSASDGSVQKVAQKYPFSEVDKEMFRNFETQKIESPYSSASVKTFSKDILVTIEKDEFNDLHENALERSESIACDNMQALKNTSQENFKARKPWEDALSAASESNEKFKSLKFDHHNGLKQVQLSQQDLAHLLQFSKYITLFYSTIGGSSAVLQVSLCKSTLTPSKLLASFIAQASEHEQDQSWIWT